ncbi:MAG: 16S rRNA (uracil(1498)-N(3))-methyltransferase [Coriobacteriia bacterium]|nr:16S rRNA (uracil(1498)-N(3))-methyltransferase [Coriobacteriia bacterium]
MSNHRFFLAEPLVDSRQQQLPLSAMDLHHAIAVLRVKAGETIEIVEPTGDAWLACVVTVGTEAIDAEVGERIAQHPPQTRVTLFQGVAKGEKMDDVVRQAVEVGALAIIPVLTSRSVVKYDDRKRQDRGERWRRIAQSAAKQAHRDFVPKVSDPVDFAEGAELFGRYERAIVLWEEHRGGGLAEALSGLATLASEVALFVGPEGGLAAEEVDALVARGARVATLGPSVLRTETAAVVALALAIHELGGLGRDR